MLEDGSRALNEAYARLHFGINVVDNSAYDSDNHNIELAEAMRGDHGGTVAGDDDTSDTWLHDPDGVTHGKLEGTDVRVYHARDYIPRLERLKGKEVDLEIDPAHVSQAWYVIEATGRSGDQTRLVSALIRENEPFSSFVFFQNRHPLGISGSPRGLVHSNDRIDFYFPNGDYQDPVSAANGFGYQAGADTDNTNLVDANDQAQRIDLEGVDFADLAGKADLFRGQDGLDAEVRFYGDGRIRIREYTKPRIDTVEQSYDYQVLDHYDTEVQTQTQPVQVGVTTEERTRNVAVYTTEEYTVEVPVYENQQEERTRQVPIYEEQMVTRSRWVQQFFPYDNGDPDGGTAVGGGGGAIGEWRWVQEEYQVLENVIVGYDTETYTVTVQVVVSYETETRTRQVVDHYETETYTVEVPVYEDQQVEVTVQIPVYRTETYTYTEEIYVPPSLVEETYVDGHDSGGTIFIDGRITKLYGDVNTRATVVGNERVRVTGNLRYVDDDGDYAMSGGSDYSAAYERNPDYNGQSVLGILSRDDVLFTDSLPNQAEINATLMSVEGRVGIDGFAIESDGDPTKSYMLGLTAEQIRQEEAYDMSPYRTERFRKDSLRRIGGVISNDRILETYIRPDGSGNAYVDAGFRRGSMKFDFNLLFNPPPNFVEVPRPVVTYFTPVYVLRES
jgi:hypothetical protein